MADTRDTIVAISTPPGRGGIGVIRLSGPAAGAIGKQITGITATPRYAHYCQFRDRFQQLIDNGLLLYFPAPHSYTGEEVVELHAHGGRIILDMLLAEAAHYGARFARPGEFTERAFLNDKLDLVQAEAVADLIDSVSSSAARSASRSLNGEFSGRLARLQEAIISARVSLEGALDFPEEDLDSSGQDKIKRRLQDCLAQLQSIFRLARQGAVMREGLDIVILGRPNVGKSTFMNRLAGHDAAIVTDIPGTTRDMISVQILIDDIPVYLTDTAGLRDADNKVEEEGVRRAREAAANAGLVVVLKEFGESEQDGAYELGVTIDPVRSLIIHNKIDLAGIGPRIEQEGGQPPEIYLSAKTGQGMELFTRVLQDRLGLQDLGEDVFMARSRHVAALEKTISRLQQAIALCKSHDATELVAEELRLAQSFLGEITGEFVADDLLGEIFSRFCIGK